MDILMIGRAASELGISTDRLRDWAKLGLIPFTLTLGGRYRWTRKQLNEVKDLMGLEHADDAGTTKGQAGSYTLVRT